MDSSYYNSLLISAHDVSTAVNSANYDDAECLEPLSNEKLRIRNYLSYRFHLKKHDDSRERPLRCKVSTTRPLRYSGSMGILLRELGRNTRYEQSTALLELQLSARLDTDSR